MRTHNKKRIYQVVVIAVTAEVIIALSLILIPALTVFEKLKIFPNGNASYTTHYPVSFQQVLHGGAFVPPNILCSITAFTIDNLSIMMV